MGRGNIIRKHNRYFLGDLYLKKHDKIKEYYGEHIFIALGTIIRKELKRAVLARTSTTWKKGVYTEIHHNGKKVYVGLNKEALLLPGVSNLISNNNEFIHIGNMLTHDLKSYEEFCNIAKIFIRQIKKFGILEEIYANDLEDMYRKAHILN